MAGKIDLWGYYKRTVRGGTDEKRALDIFWKDCVEHREVMRYIYDILNRKKPTCGSAHDWNAALSAMSSDMDSFEKAFWKFYNRKTVRNAELFSEAYDEIYPSFRMAREAIFNSEFNGHWNKVKDEVKREVEKDAKGS